jgi:hypothetical protein
MVALLALLMLLFAIIAYGGVMEHPSMVQADLSGEWDICGSNMVCSSRDIVCKVFSADDCETDYSGEMLMYLFRRFGYPVYGWDGHKSVVDYCLTTPDPDVMLWCKPSSRLVHSFGFGLREPFARQSGLAYSKWKRGPRTQPWEETKIYGRIEHALIAAMSELMRPVRVRDVPYTLLGRTDDTDPVFTEEAKRSPQAGYGLGDYDPVAAAEGDS